MPRNISDGNEILSKSPGWFTRSGSMILLVLILLIFIFSYLIKYPDIIETRITVTTDKLPSRITAQRSGYLKLLNVADGEMVKRGQEMAIIRSSTSLNTVEKLKINLEKLKNKNYKETVLDPLDSLGTLSNSYNQIVSQVDLIKQYMDNPLGKIQLKKNNSEIDRLKETNRAIAQRIGTASQTKSIIRAKYKRDSTLHHDGVLTLEKFEQSRMDYLNQKQLVDNMESEIRLNNVRIKQLLLTQEELITESSEQLKLTILNLEKSIQNLENEIRAWDFQYVLRSPIDGEVSYFVLIKDNQYINAGDHLMVILPGYNSMYGYCQANSLGVGKIEPNQQVNIQLDNFPFQEYGVVSGRVESISKVSVNNTHMIKISLPDGLKTNYYHQLKFTQEMTGNALIITRDLRLIDRFVGWLRVQSEPS